MPTKKRFFTKNKKKIPRSAKMQEIGNKSVNTREFIQQIKPVQAKKDIQPQLSPNNLQSIPDPFRKLALGLLAILAGLALWQGIGLGQKAVGLENVLMQRKKLTDDLALWEGISKRYPTYRDAYFQAALLTYRLGETEKEKTYLDKTLLLDPNYGPARDLMIK